MVSIFIQFYDTLIDMYSKFDGLLKLNENDYSEEDDDEEETASSRAINFRAIRTTTSNESLIEHINSHVNCDESNLNLSSEKDKTLVENRDLNHDAAAMATLQSLTSNESIEKFFSSYKKEMCAHNNNMYLSLLVYKLPILIGAKPSIYHINSYGLPFDSNNNEFLLNNNRENIVDKTRHLSSSSSPSLVRKSFSHSSIKSIDNDLSANTNSSSSKMVKTNSVSIEKAQYDEYLKIIEHLSKKNKDLMSQLETNESLNSNCVEDLERERAKNVDLTSRVESYISDVKYLKEYMNELMNANEKLKLNEIKMSNELNEIRTKYKVCQKSLGQKEEELDQTNRALYEEQKKTIMASNDLSHCKLILNDKERENRELNLKVEQLMKDNEKKSAQIESLSKSVDSLIEENKEKQERLKELHSKLLQSEFASNEINNNYDFSLVSNNTESFSLVSDPIKVFLNNNKTVDLNDMSLYNKLNRHRLSAQFPPQKPRVKNQYHALSNCKSLGNGLNKIGVQEERNHDVHLAAKSESTKDLALLEHKSSTPLLKHEEKEKEEAKEHNNEHNLVSPIKSEPPMETIQAFTKSNIKFRKSLTKSLSEASNISSTTYNSIPTENGVDEEQPSFAGNEIVTLKHKTRTVGSNEENSAKHEPISWSLFFESLLINFLTSILFISKLFAILTSKCVALAGNLSPVITFFLFVAIVCVAFVIFLYDTNSSNDFVPFLSCVFQIKNLAAQNCELKPH